MLINGIGASGGYAISKVCEYKQIELDVQRNK